MRIVEALDTVLSGSVSSMTCPTILTGLYALGFSPVLTGVRPKKMQSALPAGQ
jgi:hypothetical protein